jgi:hypothetical protein
MVGWIFEQKGKEERENYIVAAHWYSRALSISECSPPHRALAPYYYFGLGGYYNYRLAFEHLQKSEQDPVVKMMTAELLSRGLGVAENKKEARNLFRSAASSGYPAALMGLMLLEKSERNYIPALVYFIRGLYAAIKLVVKNKNDPLLTGIGGKRGTIRRDWVVKQKYGTCS